jgi:hypothetical protein
MEMGKWSAERLAASTGIAFVVVFVVSFFVATKPPDSTDPNPQWVAYFQDNHKQTLISAVLLGAAMMFFVWFAASVGAALRAAGEPRLAAVAFGGAVAATAIGGVIAAVQVALTSHIALEAPAQTKAFVDVSYAIQSMISFPVAVFIGATAIASWRAKLLPQLWSQASLIVALGSVSAGATVARTGFFRPDGAWAFITLIAFLVWMLVTSAWLAMRAAADSVAEVAPAH